MNRRAFFASALSLAMGCYQSHQRGEGDVDDRPPTDASTDAFAADLAVPDGEVPACALSFDSCEVLWNRPVPLEGGTAPDVGWAFGGVAVVVDAGDQTFLGRGDEDGMVLGFDGLGPLGEARISAQPGGGALVAGSRALRWIDASGAAVGEPIPNRPEGSEAFGTDVAAIPGGYLLFAIPGGPGDPPAFFAPLGEAPSVPVFEPFAMREPLLPYEHAEDQNGFATHVGFEAGPGGIFPVAFPIDGGRPGALVGEGDRRGATTFVDGVVALEEQVYIYYQGFFPTLVELSADGEPVVHVLDSISGTGNNGHAASLGDDVVVLFLTRDDGSVVALPWEPDAGPGSPLELAPPDGRRTREIRSAPWPRGLLAAWECPDGACVAAIECCVR